MRPEILIQPSEVCRCPSSIVILVILALFFCYPGLAFFVIPALFFVIPALSRDPERTPDFCKRRRSTLVHGSSPGMTETRTARMFELYRTGSMAP